MSQDDNFSSFSAHIHIVDTLLILMRQILVVSTTYISVEKWKIQTYKKSKLNTFGQRQALVSLMLQIWYFHIEDLRMSIW